MSQSDQQLVSRDVRKCTKCRTATVLNVSADEFNRFQCTKCGKPIELWDLKSTLAGLAVSIGLLSLLWQCNHLV